MVKGLAKHGNRLRHDLMVKCVDVSLFDCEERLLPNDGLILAAAPSQSQCRFHDFGRGCRQLPGHRFTEKTWVPLT